MVKLVEDDDLAIEARDKHNHEIDELRKAMGTHPSNQPERETKIVRGCSELKVTLVDCNVNPYKAIFQCATATWGDDLYEDKWEKCSKENRFKVVLAALQGNTLPQALESVKFVFKVQGTPRHCFDQHARARVGSTFYSIGCRDNSKLDSSMILYTQLYDKMEKDRRFKNTMNQHFAEMKLLYEQIINRKGSWQTARAILPMCYHHPYFFAQDLLSLKGQCARRMCFGEEEFIVGVHWLIREEIKKKFSLIADFLRPGCDSSKKCGYAKDYALSNAFGCLFAGCGRWPSQTGYATFNESCTSASELEKQLGIKLIGASDWINYGENDYAKLEKIDKEYFERN